MTQARILIAESGSGYGGTAKYLAGLLPLLDREKFDVSVVSYGQGPFIRAIQGRGEKVSYQPSWKYEVGGTKYEERNTKSGFWFFILHTSYFILHTSVVILPIVLWLKKQKIKIVHLNNEVLTHLPLLVAAKLAGCHVICHLHGWRPFTRLEKIFLPLVEEWISISNAGAEYFSRELGGRPVTAAPNGLSLNGGLVDFDRKRRDLRREWGVAEDQILAVLPGRLVEWKGQEIFLRALSKVEAVREPPLRKVTGVVLGHDPSEDRSYLNRLKSLAKELGIESRIRFLPFQQDIWAVYAAADIVIHASTKPEPFGLVILEAMLASKPVIATRGGGVTDLVVEGQTGILVEPGSADELAAALAQWMAQPERAQQLGQAGAARARTLFTMKQNAAKISQVYERCL